MHLAQIQDVPADFLKMFLMVVIGLITGIGGAVGLLKKRRLIEPQPLEVREAQRLTTLEKHIELERRVEAHDRQFQEIWSTLRSENTAIRAEMRQWFQDTERALGRIEGKLDTFTKEHHGRDPRK
jgi:hypothetical protein